MNYPAPITTNYEENLRYTYPLTADSLVLDCGGYEGNFARLIHERYNCRVVIFEPVREYYGNCLAIVSKVDTGRVGKISVLQKGVGAWDRETDFNIHGAMSGLNLLDPADTVERVRIIRLSDWINTQQIALCKMNIEGMEFETIADLITTGRIRQIENLQVQFHKRRAHDDELHSILHSELLRTHRLTYHFPWVWANYELRPDLCQ